MGINGIFGIDAGGHFDQTGAFLHDVLGLVRLARHDAVAHLDTLNGTADGQHLAQVAIADPTRVTGCTGDVFRAFVITTVGADFKGADDGLDVNVVRCELAGVQALIFDAKITRPV